MLFLWLVRLVVLVTWWSDGRLGEFSLGRGSSSSIESFPIYVETRVDAHSPHPLTGSLWRIHSKSLRSVVSDGWDVVFVPAIVVLSNFSHLWEWSQGLTGIAECALHS